MKTKNAIIIVNYNKKDLLEKCLMSLARQENAPHTVFVVDNGSKDESVAMVQEKFPATSVIDMGYNSGFCKANNVGIQKALDDGYSNIILLNNDTEVDENFIASGVAELDVTAKIGMVAPRILFHAKRDTIDSAGIAITTDGMAVNRLLHQPSHKGDKQCEVFCPAGAAAFFAAEVLRDIVQDGMYFDEDYAYYFEDLDMGWRARLRGWKCVYTPDSIVYHHGSATSGGHSKFIAFHTNRNLYYNIIKNYPFPYCLRALALSVLRYPYLAALALFGTGTVSKFQRNVSMTDLMSVTVKGMWDVVRSIPTLARKRRYIQGRRADVHVGGWFRDFGVGFFASKR
jgi:GT2 family glycosyltransferase